MTFSHFQAHSSPLFKELKLLKLPDIVTSSNIIFTHDTLDKKSPTIFNDYFKHKQIKHRLFSLQTPLSIPNGSLEFPIYDNSGNKSTKFICVSEWNQIHRELSIKFFSKYLENSELLQMTKLKTVKQLIKTYFLDEY